MLAYTILCPGGTMMANKVETYWARIFVGFRPGYEPRYDIGKARERAEEIIRAVVNKGLCVTITPTEFRYKDGYESGIIVGLINYPRFPSAPEEIRAKALSLAESLREELQQIRVSVMFPDETIMIGGE